jgi:hypothetical protein
MADFQPNVPVETDAPTIEVTVSPDRPLKVGRHRFRLMVLDDSGNPSIPDEVDVIVRDLTNPTAVLEAPREIEFGKSFELSGRRSSDAGGGQVARYIWTLVDV